MLIVVFKEKERTLALGYVTLRHLEIKKGKMTHLKDPFWFMDHVKAVCENAQNTLQKEFHMLRHKIA